MVLFRKYIVLIFTILVIVGNAFGQQDTTRLKKRISERKLTKAVVSQYCQYNNLSLKINAKVTTKEKTYNLNIIYRNLKDSIIWININHNSGIPVARFLITSDSTKMLNRIDKKYLAFRNQQIVQKFGYDLSFDMIQAIFTAQLINLEPNKDIVQVYKHYKVYTDSGYYVMQNIKKNKLSRLHKKEKIDEYLIHKVLINTEFKISSMSIEDNINSQKIEVSYPEYQKKGECMKEIELSFKTKSDFTLMKLKIKNIKINKDKLSTSFKVPEKYEKTSLDSKEPQ